ncbi:MAG: hypothetical protein OK455_07555 [Thaumarchaeota archaeon]|nr:hypothetical protein [Nitrososphaerota archaeon]
MSASGLKLLLRSKLRTVDAKVLLLSLSLLAALCAYRFYSYLVTGFFVSDEFGYYYNAANGTVYGDRWFFGWLNVFLFDIFRIRTPDAFAFFLPYYLFFWGGATVCVFYLLLKSQGFDELTVALSVVSSFVLVSFILLSLGFLTESEGLCMAMLGIYGLVRFLKSYKELGRFFWLVFAALFLGFAGGTREPYVALELGAILVVVIAAIKHPVKIRAGRYGATGVAALSILFFLVPTGLMLYANTATTSTVAPLATDILKNILSNAPPPVKVSSVSLSGAPVLSNTMLIFIGGIFLGWGPIAFPLALIGLIILIRTTLRRDPKALALLILALSALASDLVVSFLFGPDPTYFTFTNYSTIIRFSGTALPAFFLTAPLFLAIVARRKRRVVGLLGVVIASLLILVPVYQVLAISNLGYVTVSPFGLDYRSPAVQVRDYVNSHESEAPFHIIGVPYGWYFTPGVDGLKSVDVYSPSSGGTLSPVLNYSAFVSMRWTQFYLYSSSNFVTEKSNSPYVLQFIPGAPYVATNQTAPFTITNSTIEIRNHDFLFTKVDLTWTNAPPLKK